MIEAFAPAKINLTLHVTGQRDDGYHLLDSLVVFVDVGDRLTFAPSDELSLKVAGPMAAGVPVNNDNLILKAARLLSREMGAKISLTKNLPAAAGIGGGSSDAAATIRGLGSLWGTPVLSDTAILGADVPVCLRAKPTRMQGIGEVLTATNVLPPAWLVLVNPGVQLSTPVVFEQLADKNLAPMENSLPEFETVIDFANWLKTTRNDLQIPAIEIEPIIGAVIDEIAIQNGCLIARMSGSGATCWGMFSDLVSAQNAARAISQKHSDWWCTSAKIAPLS
jgi:4-diphosphocytidyl-2-C-methyl-D-erythritol kinase